MNASPSKKPKPLPLMGTTEKMEKTKKRTRKPNWSKDKLLLLAQLVLERRHTIKGKFGSGVTSKAKSDAWESISFNINAAFPAVSRSVDYKKRWLQSHSRARDWSLQMPSRKQVAINISNLQCNLQKTNTK